MTGPELRALMKLRRIKTIEVARALDIHPQTVRNLWQRDEVPKLYLMALTTYVWALGPLELTPAVRILAGLEEAVAYSKGEIELPTRTVHVPDKPAPPPVRTEVRGAKIPGVPVVKNEEKPIEKKESIWSKLS